MVKEKTIENWIKQYLESIWAVVEWLQGWKIQVKKGWYTSWIILQKPWAPDLVWLYNWKYFGIEVKKDQEKVNKWINIENKYIKWDNIAVSYKREVDQIKYKNHILKQWGYHLITCDLEEVKKFINKLK